MVIRGLTFIRTTNAYLTAIVDITSTIRFIPNKNVEAYIHCNTNSLIKNKRWTCFKEIGNVNFPLTSGVLTISFMISLQLLQTPAHATTFFLGRQSESDSSILISTSLNSSGGMLAQQLCLNASIVTVQSWTTLCDLERNPFREMLPNSSFMSWIILLKDMLPPKPQQIINYTTPNAT